MKTEKEDPAVLSAYMDGELSSDEAAKLQGHVLTCPLCSRELPHLQRLKDLIREKVQVPSAPPALKSRIRMELKKKGERPAWVEALWENLRAPAWAALAVIILIMVGGWGYYQWRYLPQIVVKDISDRHQQCSQGTGHNLLEFADIKGLESWYRANLAYQVSLPRFRDDRVTLMGGKRCRVGGMHIAHTVFLEGDNRISLFALPQGTCSLRSFKNLAGKPGFYHTRQDKVDIIFWQHGTLIYAMAYEGDLTRLTSIAESSI